MALATKSGPSLHTRNTQVMSSLQQPNASEETSQNLAPSKAKLPVLPADDLPRAANRAFWRTLLATWQTPRDAYAWAASVGIARDDLGRIRFLIKESSKPPSQGGIGICIKELYRAIASQPRFLDAKTGFPWRFKREPRAARPAVEGSSQDSTPHSPVLDSVEQEIPPDLGAVVSNWKSRQQIESWAATQGLSVSNVTDTIGSVYWLMHRAALPPSRGGIGRCMRPLLAAILAAPSVAGDFTRFSALLRSEEASGRASNSGRLADLLSCSSPRAREHFWRNLISSWHTPEDAFAWAERVGISRETFSSLRFIHREASKPREEGGLGVSLRKLYDLILQEPRFRAPESGFPWNISSAPTPSLSPTVLSETIKKWKTRGDIVAWAEANNIPSSNLLDTIGNQDWLLNGARRPRSAGGLGVSLADLHSAIMDAPQFLGDFSLFRRFLQTDPTNIPVSEPELINLIKDWRTAEHVVRWAESVGIDRGRLQSTLGSSKWLMGQSGKPVAQGGIGKNLKMLYFVLRAQFGSFAAFQALLGKRTESKPPGYFKGVVEGWKRYADVVAWCAEKGITEERLSATLGNGGWLQRGAKKDPSAGGIGEDLRNLQAAIRKDSRFPAWEDWQRFIGCAKSDNSEALQEDLDSEDGRALESLAHQLGEPAVAEFLSAKYQHRLRGANKELHNLSSYLGDAQISFSVTNNPCSVPIEIFSLESLKHLRHAFFNHHRDTLLPLFAEGIDRVEEQLSLYLSTEDSTIPALKVAFVEDLRSYFRAVSEIAQPTRLKTTLSGQLPFPAMHQKVAMHEIAINRSLLLADEMGGGKTGSSVCAFESLRDQGISKKALIVCPAKVLPVWKTALSSGPQGLFRPGHEPTVAFIGPGAKDWDSAARADYLVATIGVLRGKRTSPGETLTHLKSIGADFFIFDEAHSAKSDKRRARDTERIYELSQADSILQGHLILLSGTPIPNTLRDISAQIRLLMAGRRDPGNLEIHNLSTLTKQLLQAPPLVVRNLLVRQMLRRKTEECLPVGCELRRDEVRIQLGPVERERYRDIVADPLYDPHKKLVRLRRECLHSEAKFKAVEQAILDSLSSSKYVSAGVPAKVVVAESGFKAGITRATKVEESADTWKLQEALVSRLQRTLAGRAHIFVLDGSNSHLRDQIIGDFSAFPGPAVLLTLASVSGEGINLTCAADAILLSPAFTKAAEDQFVRRLLRAGQSLPVDLKVFVTPNTIEEGILRLAARKYRALSSVLDGRPLTEGEKRLLADDVKCAHRRGPLLYAAMMPREKALWILARLQGLKGAEAIRTFLERNNGEYARDFAVGFIADEEISYAGNTGRLVKSVLSALYTEKMGRARVADVACGCRSLERMCEGDARFEVASSDINQVALETGGQLLRTTVVTKPEEIVPMHSLPLTERSQDFAVLSLALDLTFHRPQDGGSGRERIFAIKELNRILKPGGSAIITLQDSKFPDDESFETFVATIEQHFGFESKLQLTGHVVAFNIEKNERYKAWLLTLTKVAEAKPRLDNRDLWRGLFFRRKRASAKSPQRPRVRKPSEESSGAFQDHFVIRGSTDLKYAPTTPIEMDRYARRLRQGFEEQRIGQKIDALISRHGSVAKIPEAALLSLTPEELISSEQVERDRYFELLLTRYGSVARIPVEQISKKSAVLVVRGHSRRRGPYLVLVRLEGGQSTIRYAGQQSLPGDIA